VIKSIPSYKTINQRFSNAYERIDESTIKAICRQCGGKGFYLHQNYNVTSATIDESEIVNCDQCESGFIYGKKG